MLKYLLVPLPVTLKLASELFHMKAIVKWNQNHNVHVDIEYSYSRGEQYQNFHFDMTKAKQ